MINNYSIPGRSLFQWHLQGNRSAAQNAGDISDQIRSAEMVHHNSAVAQIFLQQGSFNRHRLWWNGGGKDLSSSFALAYIFSGIYSVLLFKYSSFLFSGNTIYLWRLLLHNMHFHYYTPLLLLVSFFQGIAAYPVNYNHDNGRSESDPTTWPSPQTTSSWRMFQATNSWSTQGNGNTMVCTILQLLRTRRDTNHSLSCRNTSINA